MLSPKELKEMTERGLVEKSAREEKERIAEASRLKMEAAKQQKKEQDQAAVAIAQAQLDLEWAAKNGENCLIVRRINHDEYDITKGNVVCLGVPKIIMNVFQEQGFTVSVHHKETERDPEGYSSYEYYIKVSW